MRSYICHNVSLIQWIIDNDYPKFPIYLEYSGETIGYTDKPTSTWDGSDYEILTFNDINE